MLVIDDETFKLPGTEGLATDVMLRVGRIVETIPDVTLAFADTVGATGSFVNELEVGLMGTIVVTEAVLFTKPGAILLVDMSVVPFASDTGGVLASCGSEVEGLATVGVDVTDSAVAFVAMLLKEVIDVIGCTGLVVSRLVPEGVEMGRVLVTGGDMPDEPRVGGTIWSVCTKV